MRYTEGECQCKLMYTLFALTRNRQGLRMAKSSVGISGQEVSQNPVEL